jgi:hypothetical protein
MEPLQDLKGQGFKNPSARWTGHTVEWQLLNRHLSPNFYSKTFLNP